MRSDKVKLLPECVIWLEQLSNESMQPQDKQNMQTSPQNSKCLKESVHSFKQQQKLMSRNNLRGYFSLRRNSELCHFNLGAFDIRSRKSVFCQQQASQLANWNELCIFSHFKTATCRGRILDYTSKYVCMLFDLKQIRVYTAQHI